VQDVALEQKCETVLNHSIALVELVEIGTGLAASVVDFDVLVQTFVEIDELGQPIADFDALEQPTWPTTAWTSLPEKDHSASAVEMEVVTGSMCWQEMPDVLLLRQEARVLHHPLATAWAALHTEEKILGYLAMRRLERKHRKETATSPKMRVVRHSELLLLLEQPQLAALVTQLSLVHLHLQQQPLP
jgi:hypothetical protein